MILTFLCGFGFASATTTVEQITTLEAIIVERLSTDPRTSEIMKQASEEAKQYTIRDAVKFLREMGATSETLTDPTLNADYLAALDTWIQAIIKAKSIPAFCPDLVKKWAQKSSGGELPVGWLKDYETQFNDIVLGRQPGLYAALVALDGKMWSRLEIHCKGCSVS